MHEMFWNPDQSSTTRSPISLNKHLKLREKTREWATELELLAVQLLYKVQIICLKNTSDGFKNSFSLPVVFDILSLPLKIDFDSFNQVYIYHHVYGNGQIVLSVFGGAV